MAIDKAKLVVTLPDGFVQKGETEVVGDNKLKVVVTAPDKDVTNARVAVKYNEKYDASVILSVVKPATLTEAKATTPAALFGSKYTVVLKFDKKPELDKISYEVPSDLVVEKKVVVSETEIRYIFKVPNRNQDGVVLKFSYNGGEAKEITTNIKAYPNRFLAAATNKGLYTVGETAEVELTYLNNAVYPADAPEFDFKKAAGVKVIGEPVVKLNKAVYKLELSEAGEKTVFITCYKGNKENQSAKMVKFNVK